MDRPRAVRLASLCAVAAFLLTGLSAAPAAAHQHPQAPFVEEPAVVEVQAAVDASIDQTQQVGSNVVTSNVRRTFVLATGSGFTVNGDGTILTVTAVVPTAVRPSDLAAINQALSRDYGIVMPAGAFAAGTRVRACSHPAPDRSTCVSFSDPVVRVFPFVSPALKQGLTAAVLRPGHAPGDVAVIKVSGNGNMPAVNLAASVSNLEAFTVLGFKSQPNGATPPTAVPGHFKPPGSHTINPADLANVLAGLRAGLRGGPLVDDNGRVVGLISDVASASGERGFEVQDLAALRAALAGAGVTATQGPVDTAFQSAASFFQARHYTPAVPGFRQVLALYPGHALAQQELRVASAKAGGPEDLHGVEDMAGDTSESGSQRPLGLWLGAGGAVLLLATVALAVLLRQRRRGRRELAVATAAPPALMPRPRPPVSGSASAPASPASGTGDAAADRRSLPRVAPRLTRWSQRSGTPPRDGSLPPALADAGGHGQRPRGATPPRQQPGPDPGSSAGAARTEGKLQPAFCTRCGGPLTPLHRFCGFCGAPVNPAGSGDRPVP
jgi:S1-C subfamily serine protease